MIVTVFLLGAFLIFSRRPDALLNAQFYIEDGTYWYAQAHEQGALRSLTLPFYRGYFTTIQRIAGMVTQTVPLRRAPLVMNLLAILLAAIPAAFIASKRFASVLPRPEARLIAAFLYIGLPGASILMANMANVQWFFSLLAGFVVVARPPQTKAGKSFDIGICTLSGLSGPASIFLAPVGLLAWWVRRTRWSLCIAGVVSATAIVQGLCLTLSAGEPNLEIRLGASPFSFANLFARRVVLETFIGDKGNNWLLTNSQTLTVTPSMVFLIAALGALFTIAMLWKSTAEFRLLFLFVALVYLAGIIWEPAVPSPNVGYWEALTIPGSGNRYFVGLVFLALCSLVWLLFKEQATLQIFAGLALAVVFIFGVRLDWREPPLRDYDFKRQVAKYERAQPGERISIVTPPGWSFILTKQQNEMNDSPGEPRHIPVRHGSDVPSLYDPNTGTFFISKGTTADAVSFNFGAPGLMPLAGDWEGDGIETVGVHDPVHATFALKSSAYGVANERFSFGWANVIALAGDWDCDGQDTVGIYWRERATFFLTNVNAAGEALYSFTFGEPNAIPVAGDWDGDGTVTVGIYVPDKSLFILKKTNLQDQDAVQLTFGPPGLIPVAGDWDGDGRDSVGLYNPADGKFLLRNSLEATKADVVEILGAKGMIPLAGHFQ